MKTLVKFSMAILFLAAVVTQGCSQNASQDKKQTPAPIQKSTATKYKVTFIELGSVRCIPCQKMQPIMKSVEEKYAGQVKVVFYDVWTPEGKPYARKYGIRAIPTQVFLDKDGKEYFRHEGYFPEEELVEVLKKQDVK